jgi:hypothetical protein
MISTLVLALSVSFSGSTSGSPQSAAMVAPLPLPAEGVTSMGSRLVAGADGKLYVSWVEETEAQARLRYSMLRAEGWSAARTIAEGANWMVNWADYPQLAVESDGSMAATWLERTGAEGSWDYGVRVAVSPNGSDWFGGVSLHESAAGPEHGFVSLVPMSTPLGRGFGAVWLDSRSMGAAEEGDHGAGAMALMFRRVALDKEGIHLGPELVLDSRTCDCCATAAVPGAAGGVTVAYRDRSPDEVRDIAILHLGGAAVIERADPPADHWVMPGCPVNGPSLTRLNRNLGLAWFTLDTGLAGKSEPKPRVKAAFGSVEDGFGLPRQVDLGAPIGRAVALLDATGRLYVAWLERGGEATEGEVPTARWMLRDMGREGRGEAQLSEPLVLAEVPATRASGFASLAWRPRSLGSASKLIFAFTNAAPDGTTHVETRVVSGL